MIGPKTDNAVTDSQGVTQAGRDVHGIPPELHKEMMQTALATLRRDLEGKHAQSSRADTAEIALLNMKIAEQERRLANPAESYQAYIARIAELEQLLENATVEIGDNRIKAATAALEAGNDTLADEIFAEVEALEEAAVIRSAEAAFGRGLIAEGAIRWKEAAAFYAKAARLLPEYRTYRKASEFAGLSGDFAAALRIGSECLAYAQDQNEPETLASALNSQALYLEQAGRYEEAEPLYRQALKIDEATLGLDHPAYATRLNNLAALLEATGRYEEAEPLYRQALEIDEATLGRDHPDYATRLNNLAVSYAYMKRYAEAEPLMVQALQITQARLGAEHPDTISSKNSLEAIRKAMK